MQHNKSTKKVEQIEKISKSKEEITYSITKVIHKFDVKSVLKPFDVIKRSGTFVSSLTITLIILPFITIDSVWELFANGMNEENHGGKDSFYELKNNPKMNWRALLYGMAKRFYVLTSLINDENLNLIKALILDDTSVSKTGKNIEGVGYVHDHLSGSFILGYKILVSGYWDGVSFIPIDFSIHREKRDGKLKKAKSRIEKTKNKIKDIQEAEKITIKKISKAEEEIKELQSQIEIYPNKIKSKKLLNKTKALKKNQEKLLVINQDITTRKQKIHFFENAYYELKNQTGKYGLKKNDYNKQLKKKRPNNTYGYNRKKEADTSKIDSAISMIKRAVSKGFKFEYVLTDSWFFCGKLIKSITSLDKGIHLVSMAKISNAKYKILPGNKYISAKQILVSGKRNAHINRTYKAKYIKIQATYQDVRVVLFFVNIGKGENWRLLVSTDTNISFNKLMEVYKIRWTIEVFFKEVKQYLLLGKSQSQNFDAQIADTTLSLIRYILLSYYERTHYGISIGGIFRKLSQASVEENLVADLSYVFMDLLKAFAHLAGIDFMTFYEEMIREPQTQILLNRLKLLPDSNAA